jgi:hypothetical protein
MSESVDCTAVREMAPEVAIGVASAEDRAAVLEHVLNCSSCRDLLADLSTVVDDIVALAPRLEPPGGFESDVLDRLRPNGAAPPAVPLAGRPRRARPLALVAAAVIVVAGLTATVVYRLGDADRKLADYVRATLAVANGEYYAAAELLGPDGAREGVLFAYQGHPSWVFLVVEQAPSPERFTVEYVTLQGSIGTIGDGVALSTDSPWGTVLPVAVHEIAVVRVLDADGDLVLSARLLP